MEELISDKHQLNKTPPMALSLPTNGLQDQEHAQEWRGRAMCWACPAPLPSLILTMLWWTHNSDYMALWVCLKCCFFLSKIDLQCCGGFMCTAQWFSFMYTHTYILLQTLCPSRLLYTIEYSPLCCLSILYIVVCMSLDFPLLHSSPLWWKGHLFWC